MVLWLCVICFTFSCFSGDTAESELGFEVECFKEESDSESNNDRNSNDRKRKFTLTRGYSVSLSDSVIHYDDDDGMDLVTKSREGLVAELHDCPSENRKMLILQVRRLLVFSS